MSGWSHDETCSAAYHVYLASANTSDELSILAHFSHTAHASCFSHFAPLPLKELKTVQHCSECKGYEGGERVNFPFKCHWQKADWTPVLVCVSKKRDHMEIIICGLIQHVRKFVRLHVSVWRVVCHLQVQQVKHYTREGHGYRLIRIKAVWMSFIQQCCF